MEIILQEYVNNLGRVGDLVNVKSGFARNFLIPQGMGIPATAANKKDIESRLTELRADEEKRIAEAQKIADTIGNLDVQLTQNAMEDGHLYGSVGIEEVMEFLAENGVEIERKQLNVVDSPIRVLGTFDFVITLFGGVSVAQTGSVVSPDGRTGVTVHEAADEDDSTEQYNDEYSDYQRADSDDDSAEVSEEATEAVEIESEDATLEAEVTEELPAKDDASDAADVEDDAK